jgi:(2Fe-2S) ferredoxin
MICRLEKCRTGTNLTVSPGGVWTKGNEVAEKYLKGSVSAMPSYAARS